MELHHGAPADVGRHAVQLREQRAHDQEAANANERFRALSRPFLLPPQLTVSPRFSVEWDWKNLESAVLALVRRFPIKASATSSLVALERERTLPLSCGAPVAFIL